ncbi:hypothetical protein ACQR1Q_08890 [Bradyrhizobium oligotrophicum]|uniref:hypothetical protein n=1 Tax=Bradyrhizobium oligotrophicum TaxID=44255 RepID=UPI003EBC5F0B
MLNTVAPVTEQARAWYDVSIHEAAHAITAFALDKPIALINVFVDESGVVRGAFFHAPPTSTEQERQLPNVHDDEQFCETVKALVNAGRRPLDPPTSLINDIVIRLAAIAVFLPVDRRLAFSYGYSDIDQAARLAQALSNPNHSADELLNSALERAAEICDRHLNQILALGNRLAVRHRMESDEIKATLKAAAFPVSPSGPPDQNDPIRWPAVAAAMRTRILSSPLKQWTGHPSPRST